MPSCAPGFATHHWQVAGGIIAGLAFGMTISFGLFIKPMSDDLGLRREELSLAVGLSMLANGFASILWGAINDKFGVVATVLCASLGIFGALWMTSFGRAAVVFYFSIPLFGFFDAGATPGVILGAVGRLFSDETARQKAIGCVLELRSAGPEAHTRVRLWPFALRACSASSS